MATARKLETRDAGGTLKERLVAVASDILETRGLDALTLRAAARAAGVSHMAPYRHFADKDALLAAVAETGFRELGAVMSRAAARETKPRARLLAIGRAYLKFARRRPALYRLMFGPVIANKARFPGLAEAGSAAFAQCAEAVAAAEPAAARPANAELDPLTIATWSLVHGLASLLIDGRIALPGDIRSEERMIDAVLSIHGTAFA